MLFVRSDLGMGKGKIGAQCSHAVLKTINQESVSYKWDNKIIVYSVESEQDLFKIKSLKK